MIGIPRACCWPSNAWIVTLLLPFWKRRNKTETGSPGPSADTIAGWSCIAKVSNHRFVDKMDSIKNTARRLFSSPFPRSDTFNPRSPKLFATPSSASTSRTFFPSIDFRSPSSVPSPSSFWMSHPRPSARPLVRYFPARWRSAITKRQAAVLLCIILAVFVWVSPPPRMWHRQVREADRQRGVRRPVSADFTSTGSPDPARWLLENSKDKHAISRNTGFPAIKSVRLSSRPRAALISLVRNSELEGMMQSMRQLEFHWNRKFRYPWIFFNDEPFSDEFKVTGPQEPETQHP